MNDPKTIANNTIARIQENQQLLNMHTNNFSKEKSLERNGSVYRVGAFDQQKTREFANMSVSSQYTQ